MTGAELAAFCAAQDGSAYNWGGLGHILTEAYIKKMTGIYPVTYTATYVAKLMKRLGQKSYDCVGLIKHFLWGNKGDGVLRVYTTKEIGDVTANGLFNLCTEKGNISMLPEIPGLLLHRDGHVGVYLGNGKLVEARGVDYGVVISEVSKRNFTSWGKLPGVEYAAAPAPESKTVTFAEAANILKAQGITSITL